MQPSFPLRIFFLASLPCSLLTLIMEGGCGDSKPDSAADGKPENGDGLAFDEPAPPKADTGDEGGWETDSPQPAAETDGPADSPPATAAYRGPCSITWTTGAALAFEYTDAGGTVAVDEDGDGKPEICGAFAADPAGRVSKIDLDEGCDGKTDLTIEPNHDASSNVAEALYTENGKKRQLTLVTMPSFVGIDPGYPLHAKKSAVKLKIASGLVRTASVRKPSEGPPLQATFDYDDAGRIKRIKEDFESDGSVDRRFDYGFDELGNLIKMAVTIGADPKAAQKGTAKIDYSCWK